MKSNTDPHKQKQNTKQTKLNDKQHGPPTNINKTHNKENKNEKQHGPHKQNKTHNKES